VPAALGGASEALRGVIWLDLLLVALELEDHSSQLVLLVAFEAHLSQLVLLVPLLDDDPSTLGLLVPFVGAQVSQLVLLVAFVAHVSQLVLPVALIDSQSKPTLFVAVGARGVSAPASVKRRLGWPTVLLRPLADSFWDVFIKPWTFIPSGA